VKNEKTGHVTRGSGLLESYLSKKRTAKANSLVPDPVRTGKLLDIGCGSYPYFLMNTSFDEKYGIDQSEEIPRLRGLTETDKSLSLIRQDFVKNTALPFENDFIDVVTMLAVFEHIEPDKLLRLISEIFRVLKPGGLFIMTTPAGWTDKLLRLLARFNIVSSQEVFSHKGLYSHSEITMILETCGFKHENIEMGYFEFFMNIWGKALK
jgi:SAM-dependent methyltransferase